MKLYFENIVTDLRKNGIKITQDMFDAINEFADIQNSFAHPINVDRWQDVKGKTVLFTDSGNIVAVYGNDRFMYNPNKLKISQAPEYDIFEIEVLGANVQNRRQERRDYLKGLTRTSNSTYSNTPKSTTYKETLKNIDICAKALKTIGVRENDNVTIAMPNCPQAIYMLYAINRIGAVANMVHPLSAEKEIEFYLNESQSVTAITFSVFLNSLIAFLVQLFTIASDSPLTLVSIRVGSVIASSSYHLA